jgi:sialate O-acetylesterase
MKKKYPYTILLALLLPGQLLANVKLPALIADNMVLQQKSKIRLWGWADAGEAIEISTGWNNGTKKTVTDQNGSWQITVTTPKAGGPYELIIKGKNTIRLSNVYLGEVWLCSGQSNMVFPLEKQTAWRTGVFNAAEAIAQADHPSIRMFTVKNMTANDPEKDVKGEWAVCTPANAGKFSAVAYYFAKEIQEATGYPVGLINSSWGATPAESWVSAEVLSADTDLNEIVNRYNDAVQKYKPDTANKKLVDPVSDSKSPAKLYNAMIHPLIQYAIKGVIWYQGESNSDKAWQYQKLFPALINSWRKDWHSKLPFYFVQIAPHYQKSPEIREAQRYTYNTVHKTGMAVITDAGDSLDIHPRNKEVPGHRLALWALANNYRKKDLVYSGPLYRSIEVSASKLILRFDFADGGLVGKEDYASEFLIAAGDRKFVKADVEIRKNKIIVSNPGIKKPVAVRFGWKNFPHAVLFNKAGLPASPFRTDDWPLESFGKN